LITDEIGLQRRVTLGAAAIKRHSAEIGQLRDPTGSKYLLEELLKRRYVLLSEVVDDAEIGL